MNQWSHRGIWRRHVCYTEIRLEFRTFRGFVDGVKRADLHARFGTLSGVQTPKDRAPHGGPLDGSAYSLVRHAGRVLPRSVPSQRLPHLSSTPGRLDRLSGAPHHQRRLAGHRLGRQAPSRYGLRGLPRRLLGLGRAGHPAGQRDLDPLGPRRRRLGGVDDTLCHKRGAKVAFGGIFLDAVLSSKGTRPSGSASTGWSSGSPCHCRWRRPLLLPAGAVAALPQEGPGGAPTRPQLAAEMVRRLAEANPDRVFWLVGDSGLRQRRVAARPAGQSSGDRAVALEGRVVRRPTPPPAGQQGRRPKKGDACPPPRR